jgi:hypothetical protein
VEHIPSDGKFPELFTGGNFPETFPKMFVHRFLLAYFFRIIYVSGKTFRKFLSPHIPTARS